jgi:Tol biopolymer transport system component
MRLHRSAAVLVACTTLVGGGLVVPAIAAVADEATEDRIVWNQFTADFSSMHLVSSAPDGSRQRALTHVPDDVYDQDPVFSPDGRSVVFNRHDFRQSGEDIETVGFVRASGGHVTTLDLGCVDPCVSNDLPSWTPDGRRIVFTRVVGPFPEGMATSAVLYTARPDGSDLRRLSPPGTDGVFEDIHARFAPGGSYLVFDRVRASDDHAAVFRMRPDGTDVRQLTPWELNADLPDVSPARSGPTKDLVAFETFGHGGPTPPETSRVATVPATCTTVTDCASKIRYVTANVEPPDQAFNPAWSPDGRRIAYCSLVVQGPDDAALGIVTTIRPDGTGMRQVSDPAFFSFRPNWTAGR